MNALQVLRSNMPLRDAEVLLGDRELQRYLRAWVWTAYRFSGEAGRRQDRWFDLHGEESLRRRLNRIRTFLGFAPYPATLERGDL